MIVNKIAPNYYNYNVQRVSNPNFRYNLATVKPVITNENGKMILDKAIKYLGILPERTKTVKPISITLKEGTVDKTYGIMIDKTSDVYKIAVQDLNDPEKKTLLCQFNNLGRMIMGDYDGMHFYRCQLNRDRRIEANGSRFSPINYGSDIWGLTTYGEHSKILDRNGKDKETLGSIFWAMTGQNASIYGK